MKTALAIAAIFLLAGCTVAKDNIHEDYYVVGTPGFWQSKLGTAPRDTDPPVSIGPRYCYTAYGDVVCYTHPWPRGEDHMVGYQIPAGELVPVVPAPAVVEEKTVVVEKSPPVEVSCPATKRSCPAPHKAIKKKPVKKHAKKKPHYTKPEDISPK